jgi:hypothetical protein
MTTERRSSRLDLFSSKIGQLALALALFASVAAGDAVDAQGAADDLRPVPGLCLEANTTAVDPTQWTEVIDALAVAAGRQPDFFPAALAVSTPDLALPPEPSDTPTVRIGIWGIDPDSAASTDQARELLAIADCLADGRAWTSVITHELLLAGAERILAAARLPDERGEVLIPEGALAIIDVEFHPAALRIRTTLEFEVDIGLGITISGDCWIDDVLGVTGGSVIASSTADMEVGPFGERACQKFERFMVDGGAGERAIAFLPASLPLSDGTDITFMASSVELSDDTISLSGTIEQPGS